MKNNEQLHLVLGGSGAIGQAVIYELLQRNISVKAVERSKNVKNVETIKADLLEFEEAKNAISGASYVYVCVGLPYSAKVWETQWPKLIGNVIDACSLTNAKLIFLDNVYMYGPAPLSIPFDENEKQNPQTKKGKVRKIVADMILDAHKDNKIEAVIGRAADFYGPNTKNSILYVNFLENILNNKNPNWLAKLDKEHTYAYTQDIGKALVELALDNTTYGEVWHLPAGKKITIEEILKIINNELNTNYKISYTPGFIINILSVFIPVLRELKEMLYQFNNTYDMSWDKFHKKFPDFNVTSYEEGIRDMIKSFKKK